MPINQGYLKEDEMVEFLNGKTVSSLSNNLHQLLVRLFGVVDPNEKMRDIIRRYKERSNDFDNTNKYIFNAKYIYNLESTAHEIGLTNHSNIFVVKPN